MTNRGGHDRDHQQVETVTVTWLDIARSDAFAAGWIDASKGLPFDQSWRGMGIEQINSSAWCYERGRAAAIAARAKFSRLPPLWIESAEGSHVNPAVVNLLGHLALEKAVI